VTASPDVNVEGPRQQGVKRWDHLESPDGGNDKSTRWRTKKGGGTLPWLAAVVFIVLIGIMPLFGAASVGGLTKTHVLESVFLYTWLLGGLYLFTNVVIFQSPHFEHPRTLCLEESVYLYAQILTTVGYGDITPARPRGQLCVGLFVFTAVLLIASMVQDVLAVCETMMEDTMDEGDEYDRKKSPRSEEAALRKAFEPVVYASLVFCCFAASGAIFFTFYPGEEKTLAQGVYMSLITLSTVGFGAFTPSTHTGMVVGAYWMLFGCSSLMGVITSRAAFALALKAHEIKRMEEKGGDASPSRWNRLRNLHKANSRFSRANTMKASKDLYFHGSPSKR
jgi:voltage-gated potassium channel Kch